MVMNSTHPIAGQIIRVGAGFTCSVHILVTREPTIEYSHTVRGVRCDYEGNLLGPRVEYDFNIPREGFAVINQVALLNHRVKGLCSIRQSPFALFRLRVMGAV